MSWFWFYIWVGCLNGLFVAVFQRLHPLKGDRWFHPITNAALWPFSVLVFLAAFLRRGKELRR